MTTPIRALGHSWEERDISFWAMDDDIAADYRVSRDIVRRQEAELRKMLGGEVLELFKKYVDNSKWWSSLESEMSFNRGAAAGLSLSVLAR